MLAQNISLLLLMLLLHIFDFNKNLTPVECVRHPSIDEWQHVVKKRWTEQVLDCSNFVPPADQNWLKNHPPPLIPTKNETQTVHSETPLLNIPMDYLHNCLQNSSYDLTIPPFELKVNANINYSFGICELHSLSFSGSFKVEGSFYFEWHDHRLNYKEDVSFANGTGWSFPEHIELTATELWTPSFRLVNCEVQDCLIAATNNTIALLHSNGRVQLSLHKQLEATCQLALKNFPFDEQNCGLTFILAHLHRVSDYELRALNQIDLDYMHDNDEWNVESFTHAPERVEIFMLNPYNRDKENGHWTQRREVSDQLSIRANLQLSRHPDYYICYIIVPTIVITIADLLTVIVPMETKLELSVTVLLAFTFLQGLVASSTPKVPEIPLLGLYILFALILSGVNLIVVVATLAIYNIGEEHSRPPLWLRVIGIQIWRWPLQAARRFFRYVRSRLRDRHTPPAAATSMATKEHLTVEAESQKCHEHPENPTKSAANSSFDECVAKQPDESWKVLARYQELIASALFIALQAYIFFKYLYPLLDLWAGHQKHKSYFQYP